MTSIREFSSVNTSSWTLNEPIQFKGGKGYCSTIVTDSANKKETFVGESARNLWNLNEREGSVSMELELLPGKFADALTRLDTWVLTNAFKYKNKMFPSKAKLITTEDALKPMHHSLVRAGKPMKNSDQCYPDTYKLKLIGCESVAGDEEGSTTFVPKIVENGGRGGPGPNDTKFYLYVGTDATTGKDKYTDRVKHEDLDGSPILDASGKPVWRWVGAQDIQRNSTVKPVFSFPYVYSIESFGVTLRAHALYIKPAPQSPRGEIDGVVVVSGEDVEETLLEKEESNPPAKKVRLEEEVAFE